MEVTWLWAVCFRGCYRLGVICYLVTTKSGLWNRLKRLTSLKYHRDSPTRPTHQSNPTSGAIRESQRGRTKLPLECRILCLVHILKRRVEPRHLVPDRPMRRSRGRPTSRHRGARAAAASPSASPRHSRGRSSGRCSAARTGAAHSILITSSTEMSSTLTEAVPYAQSGRAHHGRSAAASHP
jgi:hypothetical protein